LVFLEFIGSSVLCGEVEKWRVIKTLVLLPLEGYSTGLMEWVLEREGCYLKNKDRKPLFSGFLFTMQSPFHELLS
jgi:hypothetical protein